MKLIEIKARVDFRLKPLLLPGVRCFFGRDKTDFAIREFEYFDSIERWIVHTSGSAEPEEFTSEEIITWIDGLTRKDGVAVPKFYEDVSRNAPGKQAGRSHRSPLRGIGDDQGGKSGTEVLRGAQDDKRCAQDDKKRKNVFNVIDELDGLCDVNEVEESKIPDEIDFETEEVKNEVRKAASFVHIQSPVKVYVTKNYEWFETIQGNRPLNKTKIRKIISEIKAGTNLLQECPIIVVERDGKLYVMDGQHRLEVCKLIESYVWYVIRTELSLFEIAKMNTNTEKWTNDDYLNCYAVNGDSDYAFLKAFKEEYDFPIAVCVELLIKGLNYVSHIPEDIEAFKAGQFEIKQQEEAVLIANEVMKFSNFKGYTSRHFVVCIAKIIKDGKVGIAEIRKAWESRPDMLENHTSWKDYILNFEAIINVGKHKRVIIF